MPTARTIVLAALWMVTLAGSSRAENLALCFLSPGGQQLFAQFGFAPVGLPAPAP
jgi:hypothetical protein